MVKAIQKEDRVLYQCQECGFRSDVLTPQLPLRNVDIVLFDKTGTLTKGEHEVIGEVPENVLRLAASVEVHAVNALLLRRGKL